MPHYISFSIFLPAQLCSLKSARLGENAEKNPSMMQMGQGLAPLIHTLWFYLKIDHRPATWRFLYVEMADIAD